MTGSERPFLAVRDMQESAFTFAGFRLEPDGTLFRAHNVIHLPAKELAALRVLLAHAGQVVTPLELRSRLWGDVHVTADSVPKCLSSLRARLAPADCIQTVYKRGYRLSADVSRHLTDVSDPLPRLAILPFESGNGFPEHVGLGVWESAIDRLVNVRPALASVVARDSVMTLAQDRRTARQVGEALKADLVLTGTLRALPSHLRLRAVMIRVEDGTEAWVEDLIADRGRIEDLESDFADRLVFRLGAVGLSLSGASEPGAAIETNPLRREAYDAFLRARHHFRTVERHRMQDGMQLLMHATELDPSLASAHLEMANLCCTQAIYGYISPAIQADKVRHAAQSIPESSPYALSILPARGWVNFHFDRDMPAAADAFSRCAHLPHDPSTTRLRAMFELSRHRFHEAIALLRSALREDPFAPLLHARLAWALFLAGREAEAAVQIHRALAQFPGDEWTALAGSIIVSYIGDTELGLQLAKGSVDRHPYFDAAAAIYAYALARADRREEACAVVERLQWLSRERFVLRSFTPAALVALGDCEGALAELHVADESRCPWLFQMLADPRLKPLHGHTEFERMRGILPAMESSAEMCA